MALVCSLSFRRVSSLSFFRAYTVASSSAPAPKDPVKPASGDEKPPLSSCPPGTILSGLNFLKGQPPVLAKPDEDYPVWLWDLLKPKTYDGAPGSVGEKRRLRKQNRQLLRDKNKFGAL